MYYLVNVKFWYILVDNKVCDIVVIFFWVCMGKDDIIISFVCFVDEDFCVIEDLMVVVLYCLCLDCLCWV